MRMVPHCCKQLHTAIVTSPIGNLEITCCSTGVHTIRQSANYADVQVPDAQKLVQPLDGNTNPVMSKCIAWLNGYFHNPNVAIERPRICSLESPANFLQSTWKVLAEQVPLGKTVSYGKLAQMMDNPQAARAVGTAMSRNEVLLLVPCHRVIRANGEIGVYAQGRGNHIKKWLLQHEGASTT